VLSTGRPFDPGSPPLAVGGTLINAMVILFFFQIYQGRMAVVLSLGGLASEAAQVLLEGALIYLIAPGPYSD